MESVGDKVAPATKSAYNSQEAARAHLAPVCSRCEPPVDGPRRFDPRTEWPMADRTQPKTSKLETVEPLGKRVLIRKDEDKKVTKGGIELPDSIEIPTITGRVVAVSAQIENDEDFPIRQYDRVLFNPKQAIPVEFDADNYLYVVPIDDVVAVFRKST